MEKTAYKIMTFDSVWASMPSNAQTVDLPVLCVAGLGQMARLEIVHNERFTSSSRNRKFFPHCNKQSFKAKT